MTKEKSVGGVDIEFLKEYLICRIELWCEYHNHKETMANAGMLVQIGLMGTVLTEVILPPDWLKMLSSQYSSHMSFMIYLVLWALIHVYTRWQLTNKRVAAIYVNNFEWAIRRMSTGQVAQEELLPFKEQRRDELLSMSKKLKRRTLSILNGIVNVPSSYFRMDANPDDLPNFLAEKIQKDQGEGKTGASFLEALMSYVSLLLPVLVGMKAFLN